FYVDNLLGEVQRYDFERETLRQALRTPGIWLLLSLPLAVAVLWWRARRLLPPRVLLVPALLFPLAFALLLKQKIPGYLLSSAPLLAILVAYTGLHIWRAGPRALRAGVLIAALLLTVDGARGIA